MKKLLKNKYFKTLGNQGKIVNNVKSKKQNISYMEKQLLLGIVLIYAISAFIYIAMVY